MARFLWVYIIFPMVGAFLAGIFMRNNLAALHRESIRRQSKKSNKSNKGSNANDSNESEEDIITRQPRYSEIKEERKVQEPRSKEASR